MIRHADIRLILPHRHPMLLVDAVLGVEEGRAVKAIKSVSRNEPCFAPLARELPHTAFEYPPSPSARPRGSCRCFRRATRPLPAR